MVNNLQNYISYDKKQISGDLVKLILEKTLLEADKFLIPKLNNTSYSHVRLIDQYQNLISGEFMDKVKIEVYQ